MEQVAALEKQLKKMVLKRLHSAQRLGLGRLVLRKLLKQYTGEIKKTVQDSLRVLRMEMSHNGEACCGWKVLAFCLTL